VAVEGGTDTARQSLYTALYHVFLQPAVASDVTGQFVGFDGQTRTANGYVRYQNFSGWDIYRSWIQLVSVLAPDDASDMMRSLVESGNECGALPKWPIANQESGVMVGDPADAILAGAWAFGARKFDASGALALMKAGATNPGAACQGVAERPDLATYLARGYCAVDGSGAPSGAPSVTLEYAIADFAVAQLAGALGDNATNLAFLARGKNWKNVFDPAMQANGFTGYVAPRVLADQGGAPAFQQVDVGSSAGFVEGNAAQYTFLVPQDTAGLVAALGGDAQTVARLDAFFSQLNAGTDMPQAYMGNEPCILTPWEYAWAGAPWRTGEVVRAILDQLYKPTPDGLPGNDDLGTMSAWEVWARLGVYPVVPGVGGFVVGSPTFTKVTLAHPGSAPVVISSPNADLGAPYVQSVALNGGAAGTKAWIAWSDLASGGTVSFTMGAQPNMAFGASQADRPPTF